MAAFTIKLDKEDIKTSKLGNNYSIQTKEKNLLIILTPEAIEELINDYNYIKNLKNNTK